jgi:Ribbon-helix-helix protein, copG family
MMSSMPLEKKPSRTARPAPVSFRLSQESVDRLKVLSEILGRSQAELIEALLAEEYKHCLKAHRQELLKIEARIAKSRERRTK